MRKLLTALILGAALMVFFGNALAGEKAYVPKDNEELYGTWVNMDYKTGDPPQKLTYKSDGTIYSSIYAESRMLLWKTKFQITAKWKDSEGNIWYKGHWVAESGEEGYSLYKISNSGKTCEYIFDHNECPTKVDTEHRNYRIYYRKAVEMAKEGTLSGNGFGSGTWTAVTLEKGTAFITWEQKGVGLSDSGKGPFHNMSENCAGINLWVKGVGSVMGYCIDIAPNGDKLLYQVTQENRKFGPGPHKGQWKYIGGTGKFAGIEGGGEYTSYEVQPAEEGTYQSVYKSKGSYKLP